jgi:hypothetical protein
MPYPKPRYGRRDPFGRSQLAPQIIRRTPVEPIDLRLTDNRLYVMRAAANGHVKWSTAGGRGHWRIDRANVNRTVEELIAADWLGVSSDAETRHVHLTNLGYEVAGIEPPAVAS